MDFDKIESQVKGMDKTSVAGSDIKQGEKDDHSLSNLLDLTNKLDEHENKKFDKKDYKSGSTEDFEYLDHGMRGFVETFDTTFNPTVEKPLPGTTNSGNILKSQFEEFKNDIANELSRKETDLKDAASDLLSNLNTKINQTKDFMAAERGGVPLVPEKILPSKLDQGKPEQKQPSAPSYFETFDTDSYNSSPVKQLIKEDNEKFISSEDLLGDFKEDRSKATETILKPQQVADKPLPPAPVKDIPESIKPVKPIPVEIKPKDEKPEIVQPIKPPKVEEVKITPAVPKPEVKKVEKIEKEQKMISAEEMFYKYGLVESLIYWRDVKKSGVVFGAGLITLLAISCFSVISVFAYLSLLALSGTIAFRIYKNVLGAVQKTSEGHPFKEYLELDIALSQEKVQQITSVAVAHFNGCVTELRRLFLVEDLVDSLKFGVILWVLTYIGAWFNGMTLVILAFVALFTLPKVYENNKQSIDTYLDLVRSKFLEITDKVKSAIPIGKKPETDKDK